MTIVLVWTISAVVTVIIMSIVEAKDKSEFGFPDKDDVDPMFVWVLLLMMIMGPIGTAYAFAALAGQWFGDRFPTS